MKWENPPPAPRTRNNGGKVWAQEAAELRANPGKWGVLREFPLTERHRARQLAFMVNQGRYVAFRPEGAFEAASRTEGGMVKVYAICYEVNGSE